MVIWIIGLSGSGKTTLGMEMFRILKRSNEKWFFLDGDMVRAVLGEDLGHTVEDRRKNAQRIINICKLLSAQGINVLACVLSIFQEDQKNNRAIFADYREIFIDVSLDKLVQRDNKNLYKRALKGEIRNVVGVDISFSKPTNSDIVIDNNKDQIDFTTLAYDIIERLQISLTNEYEYCRMDRLKYPHKYQYSIFEGSNFLRRYVKSRTDAINMLEFEINKLIKTNTQLSKSLLVDDQPESIISYCINEMDINIDEYIIENELITERFLGYLLTEFVKDKPTISTENMNNLLLLVKRFEVSKRIYIKYNADTLNKESHEYECIINYLLFSNLLLGAYFSEESIYRKYIVFNTLLKVNDLILSVPQKAVTVGEKLLARHALKSELDIYFELEGEHLC